MFINSPGIGPDSDTSQENNLDFLSDRHKSVNLGFLANNYNSSLEEAGKPSIVKLIKMETSYYRGSPDPAHSVRSLQVTTGRPGYQEEIKITKSPERTLSQLTGLAEDVRVLNPSAFVSGPDLADFLGGEVPVLSRDIRLFVKSGLTYLSDKMLHEWFRAGRIGMGTFFAAHREAHHAGLKTSLTWDFGKNTDYYSYKKYLDQAAKLQIETSGFWAFEPLGVMLCRVDFLRYLAVARLVLKDLFLFRVSVKDAGLEFSQMSLLYGATVLVDDYDTDFPQRVFPCENIVKNLRREGSPEQQKSAEFPSGSLTEILELVKDSLVLEKTLGQKAEQLLHGLDYYELLSLLAHSGTQKKVGYAPTIDVQVRDLHAHGRPSDFPGYIKSRQGYLENMETHSSPFILNLDLAGSNKSGDEISLKEFYRLLEWAGERTEYAVSVSGVRGFWRLVQKARISLGEAFQHMGSLGVRSFQSSPYETEGGLTLSELRNIHYAAHEYGLLTVPKVELIVPPWGGKPLWSTFIQRLLSFILLDRESGGVPAMSIEIARDSFASGLEYVKAVSLARYMCPDKIRLVTTAGRFPLMGRYSREQKNSAGFQGKLAQLAVNSGSDDLGFLPVHRINPEGMLTYLKENGFTPHQRSARFDKMTEEAGETLH